ncbi:rhomboid family intramembrane serine protease (plasmid) [Pseudorhodobacter turbinis]|uniref:Rhomboid family intramembrane serine protease n=1 Tax=Pseudorhodobacter turbinis TaxID=2500533 RepID=A0A4P8ELN2_9RHOB|nr:rhomboid family intramembrane serine protease [Pseudorhodobacter turbinis]QCO57802.1 rhomboid family intramembrane serine protease [Pseudorhodobacter turbinis]
MFPIRDHNPSGRTPYVTYALILANIGVFLSYWLAMPSDAQLSTLFVDWGLVPRRVIWGQDLHGLFTSMFLHAGFMHLAGNMLFLWIFGDNLEDVLGHARFFGFYILSGLAAAALQIIADPASPIPMVGASGAIAGVMGGYLLLFPRAKVDILIIFVIFFRVIPIPAWIMLGLWFGVQVFNGVAIPGEDGGVAYWAHAGGFIAGLVMMIPIWQKLGGRAFWQHNHGLPPHPVARYEAVKSGIPRVGRRR